MIRLFVGCASGDDLESQAVLEYTLRKFASEPVEITWMQLSRDVRSPFYSNGSSGWQTKQWSTPFSGFRWIVPALCAYDGRAIYTDSDVIFRADIAELWHQSFKPGKCVIAKGGAQSWRFCVSLFDCAAIRTHILPASELRRPTAHQEMIGRFKNSSLVQQFKGEWNCIDGESFSDLYDRRIKLIHYSDESTQPHLKFARERLRLEGRKHWFDGTPRLHWRGDLVSMFDRLLCEAIEAGFNPNNYRPENPFGPYNIQNHAAYSGHSFSRKAG